MSAVEASACVAASVAVQGHTDTQKIDDCIQLLEMPMVVLQEEINRLK